MSKSIVVLMGGWSNEREISLESGSRIMAALEEAGHNVRSVDVTRDLEELGRQLEPRPDIVFNALHGRFGEDGCIQGVLEYLSIPYTHSGVLASSIAMNKPMAKQLFASAGIPCPPHRIATVREFSQGCLIPPPFVIKPLNEGSSVGVLIVRTASDIPDSLAPTWSYGDRVMVEDYIPGRELTVSVMGDRALGVTEIRPVKGFYDYRAKYTAGMAEHLIPAPVEEDIYRSAMEFAVRAHETLGCRGVSRADFRYDDTRKQPGDLYLLEVNTQPGMTPLSLVPEAAVHVGISFDELVGWMVEQASCDG